MTPLPRFNGQDQQILSIARSDFSGGVNTRQHASIISENQTTALTNVDIIVPGEAKRRLGATLVEDLSNDAGVGLFGYEPDGGTNLLVAVHGAKLETYTGSGTFTERKTDFTTSLQTTIVKIGESGEGDVFVVGNGTDNWFRFEPGDLSTPQDLGATTGTGSDSPPLSTVGCYFRNRLWILKSNLLYFSDAYAADYATAFDTVSNAFKIPVGTERATIPLRDMGIICLGEDQVWGLNPSAIPDPLSDKPEKILDIGCASSNTACQVGDDVYFLAYDGVRGVFRTQQDKLQLGQSLPISYSLRDEFAAINWEQRSKFCAIYWDNKYIIALANNDSTYNNTVWVYYPATGAWSIISGWNVGRFASVKFSGENRLYYIDSNDGKVYRAFYGSTDNTTAVGMTLESRNENFNMPLLYKTGRVLEVLGKKQTIGTSTLSVSTSVDDGTYNLLGTVSLAGDIYTKLLIHANGSNEETAFTDSTGKTITNTAETFDTYTKLCSHFDGDDGATAYQDPTRAGAAGAWTFVGTAALDTANKKFGTASLLLDGNSDYATLPDSADWNLSAAGWAIEAWVYITDFTNNNPIIHQRTDADNFAVLSVISGANPKVRLSVRATSTKTLTGATDVTADTWHHVAATFDGTNYDVYLDGVMDGTTADMFAWGNYTGLLTCGYAKDAFDAEEFFIGQIDEVRISSGISRWTTDFASPLHAYGQVATLTGIKKFGSASANFIADGSYLTVADSSDWAFGAEDFCMETWLYFPTAVPAGERIIFGQYTDSENLMFLEYHSVAGGFYFVVKDTNVNVVALAESYAIVADTWYHVAIRRYGSSFRLYVDGVSVTEATYSGTLPDFTSAFEIGWSGGYGAVAGVVGYLWGYLDEIRISKGEARYTADFTPAAAAFADTVTTTSAVASGKFHLESQGRFKEIKVKVTNSDTGANDVILLGYNITAFAEQYQDE